MKLTGPGRVVMLLCGAALLGYAAVRFRWQDKLPRPTPPPPHQVAIDLLYGTEKEKWLKAVLEPFAAAHPELKVTLKGMGAIDSVRAIADGREKPTVWSPADEAAVNLLDTEWSLKSGTSIVDRAADMAPQPLVLTPLVMIAWEERARVMASAAGGDPADWQVIHKLAVNPQGWMGIGGPADWGYFKPGHTAPNESNSGLQAITLMAYAYHHKRSGLLPADILSPDFQKWMRETENAVGTFGSSSGTYMKDMILYGPSRYDVIWNYESVAISDMAAAQGRWGNLAVYYPRPTLWSNHPFVLLKGDWVSDEQRSAARALREYLLSAGAQERALEFGFRPANPEVKVLTADPANPWNRLKPFGIRVDVPAVAEPPSGEVTRLLLETWRRVAQRQR